MPKARLLELFREHSLVYSKVTLSSGIESDYYIDSRKVTLSSEGLWLIATLILDQLESDEIVPDFVGGLELGAVPIVSAVSYQSYFRGRSLGAFVVRKTRKIYGMQKTIEGPLVAFSKVLIVDDVVTSGSSLLRAIQEVGKMGCEVVKVIVLVDRDGKGKKIFQNLNFTSLFTKEDLIGEGAYGKI